MPKTTPTEFLVWFDRHFSVRLPFTRFARNTVLLSFLGLVPVLILYIVLIPGFWTHLTTSDAALVRFARQILTNGLPVVFTVNAVSMIMFSQSRLRTIGPGSALALDFVTRTIAFMGLHLMIFFVSALIFGSFGGDPLQALRVAGPTLVQAAAFGNLSGVYLYATLISALPLHMALGEIWLERHGYRPASSVALALFSLAIIAAQVFLLTAIAFAVSPTHLSQTYEPQARQRLSSLRAATPALKSAQAETSSRALAYDLRADQMTTGQPDHKHWYHKPLQERA